MGALILPLLAVTILGLILYYGWLIFKPDPPARPSGQQVQRDRTPSRRPRRRL